MSYQVYRILPDGRKELIEKHNTPHAAARAALVLSAHEIKNGREGNYRTEPPTLLEAEELDLPEWVKEILFRDLT